MAVQVEPLGVTLSPFHITTSGTKVSPGVGLNSGKQFGELGVIVVVDGTFDTANYDIVVQTAANAAGPGNSGDWMDTNSRINGVDAAGTYRIPVADPVIDKVRLKYVDHLFGATDITFTATWVGDRLPVAI